jgi:hypothetical protein
MIFTFVACTSQNTQDEYNSIDHKQVINDPDGNPNYDEAQVPDDVYDY